MHEHHGAHGHGAHDHHDAPEHDHERVDFAQQHSHSHHDHFPTREELLAEEAEWGIVRGPDPEEFVLRLERRLARLPGPGPLPDRFPPVPIQWPKIPPKLDLRIPFEGLQLRPWIIDLIRSIARRRRDHRTLTQTQRDRFNLALQAAHADGSYQALAAVHAGPHMMHSMMGPTGTQRFLPWHRAYLLRAEELLRSKQPTVTIPYWDYANDAARPDWVWQPPGVTRDAPGSLGGSLPSQATVDSVLQRATYSQFTFDLESLAHNQVHNWCAGTLRSPATASEDPIFFMLHGNVDRIWDQWQLTHNGTPVLSGADAVLDPWAPLTAAEVDDIVDLGYSYS